MTLGPPDFNLGGIIERLTLKLTEKFKTHYVLRSLTRSQLLLSLMIVGYIYRRNEYIGAYGLISNFERPDLQVPPTSEAADEFHLMQGAIDSVTPIVTHTVGTSSALHVDDFFALRQFAKQGADGKAIALRIVDIIRKAASHSNSGNVIGSQISSVILPANRNSSPTSNYHSAIVRNAFEIPAIVWVLPDYVGSVTKIKVDPTDPSAPPLAVPKVGRNKRCPCNSGKKYKHCHGNAGERLIRRAHPPEGIKPTFPKSELKSYLHLRLRRR
ncbi:SEC-C metal-binding domain-containing protein [Bradyrhizobium sp. CCGE-LA001]|uniref:SEC-C metal-binding domain-containing protein n=1 Tax=Bradyrhizobium sp. CCGE-LA001 TaxID=1223566 RepID=UPI0002AACD9A|nr:SEC-C domain-containing protein [Bradyrhizobium sp. CCGE-LA001]AMA58062.1 hypothetical protein BCCGELA001_18440 [Bradyrhizobium sp. CCGE-LA001]